MATNNIIAELTNLQSTDPDPETEEKRTVCRLLKIHLSEFYTDINIPFKFFRDNKWRIHKVLYDNDDVLFYNKQYMTDEDNEYFDQVFSKYIEMLENIMDPKNRLTCFLKKWTDTSNSCRWKCNDTNSYLKSLLIHKKYQYISPQYTTTIYCDLCKKHPHDIDKVKEIITSQLDDIVQNVRKEVRSFRKNYNEIITSYTYEYPLKQGDCDIYVLGFINSIILTIISFAEKLIDLHVYSIHPIVNSVIEYYTPLDEINLYDPANNYGRHIYII